MSINTRVLVDLQAALGEGQHKFSLLCIYKGVPIDTKTALLRIEDDMAWVRLEAPGPAFYARQRHALLLSEGLLDPLICKVVELDAAQSLAGLQNLDFAGRKFANRHELRVEPHDPLPVVLVNGLAKLHLEVADLSMNGLGVFCATGDPGLEFGSGQPVQAHLQLPEGPIELEGVVRHLHHAGDGCRLALVFTGAEPQRSQLLRYIMQRRAEITAEVYPPSV